MTLTKQRRKALVVAVEVKVGGVRGGGDEPRGRRAEIEARLKFPALC